MIFKLLLVAAALPFGVGLFFQLRSVLDFFFPALRKTHRWMRFVFPALLSAAALCLSAFFWLDGLIWIAYALVISGLIEIAARLVRRILRDKRPFKDGPERMIRVFGRIWRTRLLPFALSAL
ncbi:MAG: hypothetical protein ILO68_05870 [Clostridia bacterium]|nr:hypothetical protein [Clostridia bacterium]